MIYCSSHDSLNSFPGRINDGLFQEELMICSYRTSATIILESYSFNQMYNVIITTVFTCVYCLHLGPYPTCRSN